MARFCMQMWMYASLFKGASQEFELSSSGWLVRLFFQWLIVNPGHPLLRDLGISEPVTRTAPGQWVPAGSNSTGVGFKLGQSLPLQPTWQGSEPLTCRDADRSDQQGHGNSTHHLLSLAKVMVSSYCLLLRNIVATDAFTRAPSDAFFPSS